MNRKAFNCRLLIFFISFVLLIGCATVPMTGRKQLSIIPQAQLIALSEENYRSVLNESNLSQDTQKVQMVSDVGEKIALSAEEFMIENGMGNEVGNYQWELNLIEDEKTVNAFCMPGGKIAVYTGILPVAQDENGLAVVLSHEVAHALANHGGERMSQLLIAQLGGITLAEAVEEKPEKTRDLLMLAYGLSVNIGILLPYSRGHELEADYIGLFLMARAGYDPRAAVPFWKRMSEQGSKNPPEFLSTHPAYEKRIADIQKSLPDALKYYKE